MSAKLVRETSFDVSLITKLLIISSAILIFFALGASAQEMGAKAFESKCFSCHNIGGGDKQGPDLKGLTDRRTLPWIEEFTKAPLAMSKKDPIAAELFTKYAPTIMPDQPLAPDEFEAIIELIKNLSSKNEMFTPAGAKLYRAIQPGDIDGGWRYFTGQTKFENGGVACNSCHTVNNVGRLGGGTLGPDLTAANIKYRDPELILILQNPNFPTMTEMFRDHKLNDEEIVQLFAYLQNSKAENPHAPIVATAASGATDPKFLAVGFAITILSLFGLNFIWRKRHKGVRADIVRRSKI
ncbi:MAG: c-type cytochrome [Pyrinomonadaceae bacterium]|nr:c-type cytochrome [Pyrinomonadaceae bacterium]